MQDLIDIAKTKYRADDPSHDFNHILRVKKLCIQLGEEEGANLDILVPAAILHDIVNLPKDSKKRQEASRLASLEAQIILQKLRYPLTRIEQIKTVILEHSFSLGLKASSIESAVLQDADKLDALGAIGIMRTVTCGARMKASYYHPDEPFCNKRDLNDKQFTIDHFYTKLFKLPSLMNTDSGKSEANKRLKFMQNFIEQLKSEIL
jgi:uncharacterized protein